MNDNAVKLPVELWAEKLEGRTRIMLKIEGEDPFEIISFANEWFAKMQYQQMMQAIREETKQ